MNSKLFHLLHLFLRVSSGTPLRMYFIKLHWFGLSVPKGYLFASGRFLIPLAVTYLSRLVWVPSTEQLVRIQSSQITKDLFLPSEASCGKDLECKFEKWLGIIYVVVVGADVCSRSWASA